MKIVFKEDAKTASYGDVKAGIPTTVSTADGAAYIKNGLAKKVKTKKEEAK